MPLKRVKNTAFDMNAKHFTILKVENNGGTKCFGFAIDDDGEEAYIPAMVIKLCGLTEEDIGAGFRAMIRPSPSDIVIANPDSPKVTLMPPLVMDDTDPTYVPPRSAGAGDPDELFDQIEQELNVALDRHENMTRNRDVIDEVMEDVDQIVAMSEQSLAALVKQVNASLDLIRTRAETVREKLLSLHNDMTEEHEWRELNYPSQADNGKAA